jgi:hypothetical protein
MVVWWTCQQVLSQVIVDAPGAGGARAAAVAGADDPWWRSGDRDALTAETATSDHQRRSGATVR